MNSHYMTGGHKKLSMQLEMVPESMAQWYHTQRRFIEPFKRGELVRLIGKNIWSTWWCWKLDDITYRPVKILSTGHHNR
jgi:hypothetical protein